MVTPSQPNVITLAQQFRTAVEARDATAMEQIVKAYQGIFRQLRDKIDALCLEIGNLEHPSKSEIRQLVRYQELVSQVESELVKFGSYTDVNLSTWAREAVERGLRDAKALATAAAGDLGVKIAFRGLTPDVVEQLVGFLDPTGPLFARLQVIGPNVAQAMSDAILNGVGLGYNPRKIAASITNELGVGLTDALRTVRTTQIYAYREASRANYANNADLIKGWYWMSALDPTRTCGSCFSGDVIVSGPTPEKVFSRRYTGDILVIKIAGGKDLTVTPNHPILTPNGWVKAGDLREGDDVIRSANGEGTELGIDINDYQMPISIEQVAKSFGVIATEMKCSPPDFHGDGIGSDVYIVWSNGLLSNKRKVFDREHIDQGVFGFGYSPTSAGHSSVLPVLSSGYAFLKGNLIRAGMITDHAQTGSNSLSRDAISARQSPFAFTRLIPRRNFEVGQFRPGVLSDAPLFSSNRVPFGFSAQNTAIFEDSRKSLSTDAESGRNLLRSLSGQISKDRILNIDIRRFSGHVYNLQTKTGWYIANGIMAHNCIAMHGTFHPLEETLDDHYNGLCSEVPALIGAPALLNEGDGEKWFKAQNQATQMGILGPNKFYAWDAGQFEFSQLTKQETNDVWGTMRFETALKDLVSRAE